jgi:acetyl-CoA decarbonylase/synthase complex subunit delta
MHSESCAEPKKRARLVGEEDKRKKATETFDLGFFKLLDMSGEIRLEDVDLEIGNLRIELPQPAATVLRQKTVTPPTKKGSWQLTELSFTPPVIEYPGQIVEVQLGATKSQGGTRGKSIVIGGEKCPPLYTLEKPPPHAPVVACDIFDMEIPLPKAIKTHIGDAAQDPAAWAKHCVDKFGAEMLTLNLTSTDPSKKNTSASEAAKTVEQVLQAVDVPLAIGGCGDPVKDLAVFEKVTEMAAGERLLISSVSPYMDVEKTAETIRKHGHVALALTGMDIGEARELNRRLYRILPREQIVMDTSTAALGYGLEFTFTVMQRVRLGALMGDDELQHPMSSGTTNAWFAKEAWKKMAAKWEPRELRGPMWETITALTGLLAGVDYFMMMHPIAIKTVKDVIQRLMSKEARISAELEDPSDWVTMKIK